MCESVDKADLLSCHFDSKQSQEVCCPDARTSKTSFLVLPPLPSSRENFGVSC